MRVMVVPEEGVTIVSINGTVVNEDRGAGNTDTMGQIRVLVRVDDETAGSSGGIICILAGGTAELARAKFEIFKS